MALHTELSIYKATYDLLQLVVKMVTNMRRDLKHDLGGELRRECVRASVMIYRTNTTQDTAKRWDCLMELVERLEVINLLLRLAKDLRVVSLKDHAKAIQLTTSIEKQANGWRKKYAPVS